ncbi:unnamed protein product, partial [Rotaria sp. Silwood1]
MAYDIEIWWLRCISFIIVIPYFGQHLVAIWKMIKDLLFFMCVIGVVMIAYGVASCSLVYYPKVNNFTTESGGNPSAGWSITNHILLAAHMLFVNILLINLLIAMFSKQFNQVYEETHQIWHSQQYLLMHEYFERSPFITPISFALDIYCLSRMLVFFIRQSGDYDAKVFKMIAKDKSLITNWREFESASTYDYAHDEIKALKATST